LADFSSSIHRGDEVSEAFEKWKRDYRLDLWMTAKEVAIARDAWDAGAAHMNDDSFVPRPRIVQESGPQCKLCHAFTTYARVAAHGMCMKCELAIPLRRPNMFGRETLEQQGRRVAGQIREAVDKGIAAAVKKHVGFPKGD